MAQYLYILGPFILIFFTIPLAILATVTTTLAFATLLLRVVAVYLELGLALVHSWLSADTARSQTHKIAYRAQGQTTVEQREHRKSSSGVSPYNEASFSQQALSQAPVSTSESLISVLGSGGSNRDFEGVGGWRLASDGQDEAAWMSLNSRLQLPTPATPVERHRRHRRSLSSQSQRVARSPETFRMSPVDSRNRTPPAVQDHDAVEEYFNVQGGTLDMSPEEVSTRIRMNERRLSLSSSNASSTSDVKSSASALTQLQSG